jgi:hypothetical protein
VICKRISIIFPRSVKGFAPIWAYWLWGALADEKIAPSVSQGAKNRPSGLAASTQLDEGSGEA